MSRLADGRTEVEADSDITLVGAIAQYGRGVAMLRAVSAEIINRFADNLRRAIESGAVASDRATAPASGMVTPTEAPAVRSPAIAPDRGLSLLGLVWSAFLRLVGIRRRPSGGRRDP